MYQKFSEGQENVLGLMTVPLSLSRELIHCGNCVIASLHEMMDIQPNMDTAGHSSYKRSSTYFANF